MGPATASSVARNLRFKPDRPAPGHLVVNVDTMLARQLLAVSEDDTGFGRWSTEARAMHNCAVVEHRRKQHITCGESDKAG